MAFKRVEVESFDQSVQRPHLGPKVQPSNKPEDYQGNFKSAIDRARAALEEALPNRPPEYYADTLERIILTAGTGGYSIASVADAFIAGAKLSQD